MSFHPFHGVCSRGAEFEIDEAGILRNVRIQGGCPGNTLAVGTLAEGHDARATAALLKGIPCGNKGTSCPDQLARAIEAELARRGGVVSA